MTEPDRIDWIANNLLSIGKTKRTPYELRWFDPRGHIRVSKGSDFREVLDDAMALYAVIYAAIRVRA